MGHVLGELGSEHAMVVHGTDGLDEMTLTGPTVVLAGRRGHLHPLFDPMDLGLRDRRPVEALAGGDAAANLKLLGNVLDDEPGPLRDAVCLNAAAALMLAGRAGTAREGLDAARETIASGAARETFRRFVARAEELAR